MANRREPKLETNPATRLDDVYRTMFALPLKTEAELQNLYEPSINEARGADLTELVARGLRRQHGGAWYKLFLYGSRGSGKSTEMSRLLDKVETQYKGVRIDVRQELNPTAFQPHEILLAIAIAIVRETKAAIGDTEAEFDPQILYAVEDWFAETSYTVKRTEDRTHGKNVKGGATLKLFSDFLELGAGVTGSMQSNYKTEAETRYKRKAHYAELRDAVNRLIAACTELLGASEGTAREWLIVIEDLDKQTPLDVLQELVFDNAHIFDNLDSHFICNLPLGLLSGSGSKATGIAFETMYDTPVYNADFTPNDKGRESLRKALAHRVDLGLFAKDQVERLIVASGGSLRDLFRMTGNAADQAAFRAMKAGGSHSEGDRIEAADVDKAIYAERDEFRLALGEDLTERVKVTRAQKRERLQEVYARKEGHDSTDTVLNELLVVRAVQKFNGPGRVAVHPVVVDLMFEGGTFESEGNARPGGLL